jgi:hypothetical protein
MEIQGFPNYTISRDGVVTNIKTGKVKALSLNKQTGYMYVMLYKNEKQHNITLHRLLALHYIPNPNGLRCVDHINRKKTDNRIENLRWVTKSQNAINTDCLSHRNEENRHIYRDKFGFSIQIQRNRMIVYRKWAKTIEEARVLRDVFFEIG